MSARDAKGEALRNESFSLGLIGQSKKWRGSKKQALKVQLCHAMDQMAADIKQAIELHMRRDTLGIGPANEQ